nr:hypothetical protein [Providencia sp. PROV257]
MVNVWFEEGELSPAELSLDNWVVNKNPERANLTGSLSVVT